MATSQSTPTAQTRSGPTSWLRAKLTMLYMAGLMALQDFRSAGETDLDAVAERAAAMDQANNGVVDAVGGAILSIAIVALLLNEVLGMDAFNLDNGPMSGLDIGATAVSVFGILLLGVLVMAFVWIRQIWGGF